MNHKLILYICIWNQTSDTSDIDLSYRRLLLDSLFFFSALIWQQCSFKTHFGVTREIYKACQIMLKWQAKQDPMRCYYIYTLVEGIWGSWAKCFSVGEWPLLKCWCFCSLFDAKLWIKIQRGLFEMFALCRLLLWELQPREQAMIQHPRRR